MTKEDERRWDEKWASLAGSPYGPHPLLEDNASLLEGGRALDLACGRGQNSLWLARRGYQVLAVDVSSVALAAAKAEATKNELSGQITFEQVDLDSWRPPVGCFDLVCVFRFLDRRLFPAIRAALRPGGLLFYSTRHVGILRRLPAAQRAFLLRPGELAQAFADLHILLDEEGAENARFIAAKRDGANEA